MKINIGTARINNFLDALFWSDRHEAHLSRIIFYDVPVLNIPKEYCFPVGKTTLKDAISNYEFILSNIRQANIHDGDKVIVIFDEEGNILALGKINEDVWLDVTDQFKAKSFAELNIEITSLKVYGFALRSDKIIPSFEVK